MFDKILIATDVLEISRHAIQHGLYLARALRSNATAVTVIEYPGSGFILPWLDANVSADRPVKPDEFADWILARALKVAAALQVSCETVRVFNQSPAEAILAVADKARSDLIVVASRSKSNFSRMALGSTALSVIVGSTCPTLVCPGPLKSSEDDLKLAPYRHILAATDGSELAQKAVETAIELARHLQARVTVLSIGNSDVQSPATTSALPSQAVRYGLDYAQKVGFPCDGCDADSSDVGNTILSTALDRGCDLIVVASHGLRGVQALLVGSVTMDILSRSTLPVLVCR